MEIKDFKNLRLLVLNSDNNVSLDGLNSPIKNYFKPMIVELTKMLKHKEDCEGLFQSYMDDVIDMIKTCHGIVCDPTTLNDIDLFNLGLILYYADTCNMTEGIPILYRSSKKQNTGVLSLRDQRFIVHYAIEKSPGVWESNHLVASNICNYNLLGDKALIRYSEEKGWTPIMCIGKNVDWTSVAAIYYKYGYKKIHEIGYKTNSEFLKRYFEFIPKLTLRG